MAATAAPEAPAVLKEALRPLPATEGVVEGAAPLSESLVPDSWDSQVTNSRREGRHSVLARQVLLISVWGPPAGQISVVASACDPQVARPSCDGMKIEAASHQSHCWPRLA